MQLRLDEEAPPSRAAPAAAERPTQATYLRELLEIFDAEGVDAAFVHAFAGYILPHDPDEPRPDLDLASSGVVKVLEDGTWEPEKAFSMLADYYSRRSSTGAGRA